MANCVLYLASSRRVVFAPMNFSGEPQHLNRFIMLGSGGRQVCEGST